MVDLTFDPADVQPDRFIKYGPAPIPDPRDALVDGLIDDAEAGGSVAVASLCASASGGGTDVLLAYGERMAALAVRRRDQDLLVRARTSCVTLKRRTGEHSGSACFASQSNVGTGRTLSLR